MQLRNFVPRTVGNVKDEVSVGQDGNWYKTLRVSGWSNLDGNLAWLFHSDQAGSKLVRIAYPQATYGFVIHSEWVIKYNGISLAHSIVDSLADHSNLQFDFIWINVVDIDTGWTEAMTPTTQEISAYFYGWKMCDVSGNAYVSGTKYWKKITDGTGITSTLPTASYAGYTPYTLSYQLVIPKIYMSKYLQ